MDIAPATLAPGPVQPGRLAYHLPNLDLLRAFAVLLVFSYHLFDALGSSALLGQFDLEPIGRAGVLLFFVHTSFVLMQSMDRSPSSVGEFYARRAFRIYPLSIAVVVLVLALQIPRNPAVSFVWPGWKAVVANLLLVQNLFDYKSIANPMWSLPYEVQMYLSLPIIYRVLRAASYRAWAVAGWWAGAWGASLLASYLPHGNLVYYAPCFMGGIVGFALLKSRPIAEERRIGAMAGAALLILITVGFAVAMWLSSTPSFAVTKRQSVFACAACTLVGLLIPFWRQWEHRLTNQIFHTIAKYSYGLYLTHQSLIWVCFVHFKAMPLVVRWLSFALLTPLIPVLCFHLIEHPMIEWGRRWLGQRSHPLHPERAGQESVGKVLP